MAFYKVKTNPITEGVLVGVLAENEEERTEGNTDALGTWTYQPEGEQLPWKAWMLDPLYQLVPPDENPHDLGAEIEVTTFLISEV